MLFEETNIEESGNLQSDVSSLDNGFSRMQFESFSPEDYEMVEEAPASSEDNTINPIDCYWYFITDQILNLMVRETNRYAEHQIETQDLTKRSKTLQWKPTANEEMLHFFSIIIQMRLVQMPEIDCYWMEQKQGCEWWLVGECAFR